MTALRTEACLIFPAFDALRDGYEVYPVVDAVGGTSVEGHRAALERVALAGDQLGANDVRAVARLGTHRDRRNVREDPVHRRRALDGSLTGRPDPREGQLV
jgi:hypothetical protein